MNLTLTAVCRLAGVRMNNISRWTQEDTSPIMRVFNSQLSKMEAALDAEEMRLRDLVNPNSEEKAA